MRQRKRLSILRQVWILPKLIEDLHNHGVKLALASSGWKVRMKAVLEVFNLQTKFAVMLSADDVKNVKPDPEIFLLAAQRLGIVPESFIVIEDSANGVIAAKRAGMFCIGYRGLAHVNLDLSGTDWIIKNFSKLTYKRIAARFNRSET